MKRRKFTNVKNLSTNGKTFNYSKEGEILKKTISPYFYTIPNIVPFLNKVSGLLTHLINHVKIIKKSYIYSVDQDELNID